MINVTYRMPCNLAVPAADRDTWPTDEQRTYNFARARLYSKAPSPRPKLHRILWVFNALWVGRRPRLWCHMKRAPRYEIFTRVITGMHSSTRIRRVFRGYNGCSWIHFLKLRVYDEENDHACTELIRARRVSMRTPARNYPRTTDIHGHANTALPHGYAPTNVTINVITPTVGALEIFLLDTWHVLTVQLYYSTGTPATTCTISSPTSFFLPGLDVNDDMSGTQEYAWWDYR